ncbi:MAG: cardiolipin synthase [Burkholderiales bacterium]
MFLGPFDIAVIAFGAYVLWAIFVSIGLISARRSPVATIGWLLTLLALPYIGALVYLFFGPRRLHRKRLRYTSARRFIAKATERYETLAAPNSAGEEIRLRYRQLADLARRLHQLPPLRAGKVELYVDGDSCYRAIIEAISRAADHVHLEYYIWEPGTIADRVLAALIDRARAGVKIRLLVDDVGSSKADERYFAPLIAAGAEVAWFNPLRWSRIRLTLLNFRTHRKIVVIDGRVAFMGGMNVTDSQSSASGGGNAWRDTHMRIDGSPVAALQRVFLDDWQFACGACDVLPSFFPEPVAKAGDVSGPSVQIIASGPDESTYAIQAFYFAAVANARHSLAITTPYFVPDEALLTALKSASLRGVNCRLLVPKKGDSKLVTAAARSYFDELLVAGVEIYEYGPPMLHGKTMVIDHSVAIVGSANLDNRSFRLNFEVIAVVYDALTAQALGGIFEEDLRRAIRVPARSTRRDFKDRFQLGLARLFSPLL